jgi:hypothetical protein
MRRTASSDRQGRHGRQLDPVHYQKQQQHQQYKRRKHLTQLPSHQAPHPPTRHHRAQHRTQRPLTKPAPLSRLSSTASPAPSTPAHHWLKSNRRSTRPTAPTCARCPCVTRSNPRKRQSFSRSNTTFPNHPEPRLAHAAITPPPPRPPLGTELSASTRLHPQRSCHSEHSATSIKHRLQQQYLRPLPRHSPPRDTRHLHTHFT